MDEVERQSTVENTREAGEQHNKGLEIQGLYRLKEAAEMAKSAERLKQMELNAAKKNSGFLGFLDDVLGALERLQTGHEQALELQERNNGNN